MKPVFIACSGSLAAPAFDFPSHLRRKGMPWVFMGSNGNFWEIIPKILWQSLPQSSIWWGIGAEGAITSQ
jgi:hypothetical protein